MKTTEPPIVFQSDKQLVHMKKHKIIISAVVGILVVIVLLVLAWFFAPKLLGKNEAIVFVPYEVTDETNNSWGAPAGITVKIDVPQGDQALVDTAICHIVNESFVAEQLGQPIGETLQQLVENCVESFKEAVAKDEFGGSIECLLLVESDYQNTECVVFHVTDGIYANGGPREYDQVVRLHARRDGSAEHLLNSL